MNTKTYYKRNVSYSFNEQKQREILSKFSAKELETELKRQTEIKEQRLFDKVNTKQNNLKMINLLKTLIQ